VTRWLSITAVFGLALATPVFAQSEAPPPQSPPVTTPSVKTLDLDEIDRRASLLMQQLEMTGLALAVVEGGEIVMAKGYGERLRDSGQMVTERLAPSLDLPGPEDSVSVVHLLSHQIGISKNAYDSKIEDNRAAKPTRAALSELAQLCAPGTCHTYQNVAFDASAEIIESQLGLPYKTVVQRRIFDPLGMETASVTLEGLTTSKNWARPHTRFGDRITAVKPTYYRVPAAAGVNSSVTDLAKWMIAQMPAHSPFPEDRLSAMQTPVVSTSREQRFLNRRFGDLKQAHYGLGLRVYDYHGRKVVGHRGGVEGYRALMLFDPEAEAGIAIMWNSPHTRPIGLQMEFLDQLYGLPKRDWLRLKEAQKPAPTIKPLTPPSISPRRSGSPGQP